MVFFFFKQKTAYEVRISDWSSDVCSSDLPAIVLQKVSPGRTYTTKGATTLQGTRVQFDLFGLDYRDIAPLYEALLAEMEQPETVAGITFGMAFLDRSEEHTSELQSLMRISYAVFCLKKKKTSTTTH